MRIIPFNFDFWTDGEEEIQRSKNCSYFSLFNFITQAFSLFIRARLRAWAIVEKVWCCWVRSLRGQSFFLQLIGLSCQCRTPKWRGEAHLWQPWPCCNSATFKNLDNFVCLLILIASISIYQLISLKLIGVDVRDCLDYECINPCSVCRYALVGNSKGSYYSVLYFLFLFFRLMKIWSSGHILMNLFNVIELIGWRMKTSMVSMKVSLQYLFKTRFLKGLILISRQVRLAKFLVVLLKGKNVLFSMQIVLLHAS